MEKQLKCAIKNCKYRVSFKYMKKPTTSVRYFCHQHFEKNFSFNEEREKGFCLWAPVNES